MSWIQDYAGKRVDLLEMQLDQVSPHVIGHALANICRFGGHTREFYSVAQHSVLVSRIVPPAYALHGLLHDAAEAYIGDVVRPLKEIHNIHSAGKYRETESRIEATICRRLGIAWTDDAIKAVKLADNQALATEARDLLGKPVENWVDKLQPALPIRIIPLRPDESKAIWLERYVELAALAPHVVAAPPKSDKADLAGAVAADGPGDGIPLSKFAHEIRLELLAIDLTREQNATIKTEVIKLYSKEHLSAREASYLQELIAANFRRLDADKSKAGAAL